MNAVTTRLTVIPSLAVLLGCHSEPNPLARLPHFISPPVDRPQCERMSPRSVVTIQAPGPFTLCKGSFSSNETFSLLRDSAGRTVWFARGWKASSRERVTPVYDSLSRQMAQQYGVAETCGKDRLVWTREGFSLELSIKSMSTMVRRTDLELELPAWIHFNGRLGPPEPACTPAKSSGRGSQAGRPSE